MERRTVYRVFLYIAIGALFFCTAVSGAEKASRGGIESNKATSEKRILPDDPARDAKLLALTGNDRLAAEVIREHSLIVGSKMVLVSRRAFYAWLVEHIDISAAISRVFGRKYRITASPVYTYRGDDGEGLLVDFYPAYRDSSTTVLLGEGKMRLFHITLSGSFINYMEYRNVDETHLVAQNCMYVKVNNPVVRFVTHIVFKISDVERVIMGKLLTLDDTVFQIVKTFMEDSRLYPLLKNPYGLPSKDTSELAIKIRDAVITESSPETARELGALIERARIEAGYPSR